MLSLNRPGFGLGELRVRKDANKDRNWRRGGELTLMLTCLLEGYQESNHTHGKSCQLDDVRFIV